RADRALPLGLVALRRLTHRGAPAHLGAVDGCGVLTAIPWALLGEPSGGGTRALGMLFVGHSADSRARQLVEGELVAAGARHIAWRAVPVDPAVVLPAQRPTTPLVLQVQATFDQQPADADVSIYRARLRIERLARDRSIDLNVASFSTRTVVYKGL